MTSLGALAAGAALVLTEDFPVPPFAAWTRQLAGRIKAPVWRVDTACVLPMRLTEGAFGRAYEFRRAHGEEQLRRALELWPDCEVAATEAVVPVDACSGLFETTSECHLLLIGQNCRALIAFSHEET